MLNSELKASDILKFNNSLIKVAEKAGDSSYSRSLVFKTADHLVKLISGEKDAA